MKGPTEFMGAWAAFPGIAIYYHGLDQLRLGSLITFPCPPGQHTIMGLDINCFKVMFQSHSRLASVLPACLLFAGVKP
jgi:hypothetical protein